MDLEERKYWDAKLDAISASLASQGNRLTRMETKFSMICTFAAVLGGLISFIVSIGMRIAGR